MRFPPDFSWGVATSAYQIEGAWNAGGKGPSIWDTLAHRPGGFAGGATGDVACDHYHRLDEDLNLMRRLGLTSYRFSVSWPRVQPDGRGRWNVAGLDFYDRLVDGLLARDIQPALTLYHWDHPQALEDRGGWRNRDTANRFADYAHGMALALGDRVRRWITLNEPLSVLYAAALRASGPIELTMARNLLLAHGLAVGRLRAAGVRGEIGITLNLAGVEPVSTAPADWTAAARAIAYEDRLFLDPLLCGHFPRLDGEPIVDCPEGDQQIIATPIDFLGVNWYCRARVAASATGQFGYTRVGFPRAETNMLGWPVVPEHLGELLAWLRINYANLPPSYLTENGQPLPDQVGADGGVRDHKRIDFLCRCLSQVHQAIEADMDIRGYYVWSLMDNLEWQHGYAPRFGLVHVDFTTQRRTPKDSYFWYRDLIAAQRGGRSCSG